MLRNLFSSLEGIIPESIRREPSSSRHDPLPTELKNIVDYGRDYGRGIYPVSRSQSVRPSSKPRGRDGERKSSKRSRSLEKGSRSASGSRQSSRRSSPVTFRETETAAEASRRRKAEHEKQKRRESEKHKQVMAMGVAIHIVHTMLGEQIPVGEYLSMFSFFSTEV
ncbi:hypothetical protein D9758_004398 [Tetrapyrgos nigripes]|uniref:Uncharacterized protein n=1 Tax=Tetrapyrgos nigripes TaxID=182062 RepID=A0A8H5GMS5_9AGAR|nr:hypothetical protein D9758_004398 [Tetrapyrgos nigripes]